MTRHELELLRSFYGWQRDFDSHCRRFFADARNVSRASAYFPAETQCEHELLAEQAQKIRVHAANIFEAANQVREKLAGNAAAAMILRFEPPVRQVATAIDAYVDGHERTVSLTSKL